MNCHVQIPKSILKNFAYKAGKDGLVVDYLDFNDKKIKTEKIKKLDTITGYYSESFEKHLGEKFETPFGNISKKIKDFTINRISNLTLSKKETETVLEFFNNIFLRGQFALQKANEYSLTSIIQPIGQEELIRSTKQNLFVGYWMNIIKNKTKIDFVIPRNCFYAKKSRISQKLHYIFPITPRAAIILIPNEEIEDFMTGNGKIDYYHIDDESSIKVLNDFALEIEKGTNNQFIAGNKSELERLREFL